MEEAHTSNFGICDMTNIFPSLHFNTMKLNLEENKTTDNTGNTAFRRRQIPSHYID